MKSIEVKKAPSEPKPVTLEQRQRTLERVARKFGLQGWKLARER